MHIKESTLVLFFTFAERSRVTKHTSVLRQKWLNPALPALYFPSWVSIKIPGSWLQCFHPCSCEASSPVVPPLLLFGFSSFPFCCLRSLYSLCLTTFRFCSSPFCSLFCVTILSSLSSTGSSNTPEWSSLNHICAHAHRLFGFLCWFFFLN